MLAHSIETHLASVKSVNSTYQVQVAQDPLAANVSNVEQLKQKKIYKYIWKSRSGMATGITGCRDSNDVTSSHCLFLYPSAPPAFKDGVLLAGKKEEHCCPQS